MLKKLSFIYNESSKNLKNKIILLIVFMIFGSIVEVFSIASIYPLIEGLINPTKIQNLFEKYKLHVEFINPLDSNEFRILLTIIFIIIILLSGIIRYIQAKSEIKLSNILGHNLSVISFSNLINSDYENIQSENTNKIISNISIKIGVIVSGTILPSIRIIGAGIFLSIILSIPLILYPLESIIVIAFMLLYFGTIVIVTKNKLAKNSKIISEQYDRQVISINESIKNLKIILLLGLESFYVNQFKEIDLPVRTAKASNDIVAITPKILFEISVIIIIGVTACYYSITGNNLYNIFPILGSIVFVIQKSLPEIQKIYSGISSIRGTEKQFEEIKELIELKQNKKVIKRKKLEFKNTLEFKNLAFQFKNSENQTLKNLNLKIEKGDIIGIIGETGSGKSTFVEILNGLLNKTSGEIYIDGVKIDETNKKEYRKLFGYVPQKYFLIDDTIESNIALGDSQQKIDHTKIKKVCKISQLENKINKLPQKYLTHIGEDGNNFSGGEKQRLAIARAIYKEPEILILDEATSALDSITEEKFIKSLVKNNSNMTLIMVAHRLNTLKSCNKIYEFKNGEIVNVTTGSIIE